MSHSCTSLGDVTNVGGLIHLYCPDCSIFWVVPMPNFSSGQLTGCQPAWRAHPGSRGQMGAPFPQVSLVVIPVLEVGRASVHPLPITASPWSTILLPQKLCPGAGEGPWERKKRRKKHKWRKKNCVFTTCGQLWFSGVSFLAPWSCFALRSQIAPCPILCLSSISVMGITAMSLAQGREKEHPCSGETGQAGGKGRSEGFSLGGTGPEDRGQACCVSSGSGPSSQLHLLRWGKRKTQDLTREPAWP